MEDEELYFLLNEEEDDDFAARAVDAQPAQRWGANAHCWIVCLDRDDIFVWMLLFIHDSSRLSACWLEMSSKSLRSFSIWMANQHQAVGFSCLLWCLNVAKKTFQHRRSCQDIPEGYGDGHTVAMFCAVVVVVRVG